MNSKLTLLFFALIIAVPAGLRAQDKIGIAVLVPGVGGDGPEQMRNEARDLLATILAERFEMVPMPRNASLRSCAHGSCMGRVRQIANAQFAVGLTIWTDAGEPREVVVTVEEAEHRYHGTAQLEDRTLETALREAARQAIAKAQVGPGSYLLVDGTPAEAVVHIDGELRGGIPWRGSLSPGPHEVRVTAEGYREEQRTIDIPREANEELTLRLDLEPLDGFLSSESAPDLLANFSIAGAPAIGGIAFAIDPLYTLAHEGACTDSSQDGACFERIRFGIQSGLLLGLGAALLAGGVTIAALQPLTIRANASTQSAHLQLEWSL